MISYDIHTFHVLSNQLRQVVCNKNAPAAPRTSADQSPSPNRWSSPTATAARIRGNRHSTWATATGVPWQLLSRGDILWEIQVEISQGDFARNLGILSNKAMVFLVSKLNQNHWLCCDFTVKNVDQKLSKGIESNKLCGFNYQKQRCFTKKNCTF